MATNYFGRYKTKVKRVCSGEYLVTQIDTENEKPEITCLLVHISEPLIGYEWLVGQPVRKYGQVHYDTIHSCGYPTKKDALKWLSREYVDWLED